MMATRCPMMLAVLLAPIGWLVVTVLWLEQLWEQA